MQEANADIEQRKSVLIGLMIRPDDSANGGSTAGIVIVSQLDPIFAMPRSLQTIPSSHPLSTWSDTMQPTVSCY